MESLQEKGESFVDTGDYKIALDCMKRYPQFLSALLFFQRGLTTSGEEEHFCRPCFKFATMQN